MGQRGASAGDSNRDCDRAMVKGAQKMIGSVGIIHVERSGGGGSQGRIALILRKTLRQGVPLSKKNSGAIFVFEAMNQERTRRVIFEQREIVCIRSRAGRESSQACVVKQVETEESRGFIHSKLLEFIMNRGVGIRGVRAIQNFF